MRTMIVLLLVGSLGARAEDLRQTDGTVYRNAQVKQVEPDGLLVAHEKGLTKVDFTKLPLEVRQRYGYSSRKATIYREQEARRVEQTAAENARIVKDYEERELARIRKQMAESDSGTEFSAGLGSGESANSVRMQRALERSNEEKEGAQVRAQREPRTFWNAKFWDSPVVRALGSLFGGRGGGSPERNSGPGSGGISGSNTAVPYGVK